MTDSTPDPKPNAAPDAASGIRKNFLRQVLRLAGPYWNCERRLKVRAMTLLLLLLTMSQVGITIWGNYWNRALWDALEQKDVRRVLIQVAIFAVILLVSMGVTAAHLMTKRWLQIDWRAWLTEQLMSKWLENGRHFRLSLSGEGSHDNPDQRIAEDIRIATESAIGLGHSFVFALLILGLFVNILWSISGAIAVPGTEVKIPGYMVPLAFLYAGLGTIFGSLAGRPLVRATNALLTAEATFRFGLSRVRENAESIALVHGETVERSGSSTRFKQIVQQWNRQSLAYMGLSSFGTGYGGLLPVFPILIAAPQYISGVMTLGALMQAAQAFGQLTGSLSWPVDNIGAIANCRASAERVLSLYEGIQQLDADTHGPGVQLIALDRKERPRLVVDDLCIADRRSRVTEGATATAGRMLLEHFSLYVPRGEKVLITGDPDVTACLFKAIGGLWPWGSGKVMLPGDGDNMMFIAHRPFLPEGTLRQALCYPSPPNTFTSISIRHALECVGLIRFMRRLDEKDNWEEVLPLRVQQQLGFARVLLHQPTWLVMEEATSSFDPKGEMRIFEMLNRELPNMTMLSFSVYSRLRPLHHRTLIVTRDGETKVLYGRKQKRKPSSAKSPKPKSGDVSSDPSAA
ncbi:MAG: ABC transporter ATP-binding protein/permease [Thermodesulfobacteriota bacterium]